jgi:hypothetical protein
MRPTATGSTSSARLRELVLELEVEVQRQGSPGKGQRELVHVGEGSVTGLDGPEDQGSGQEEEGVDSQYRRVPAH